MHTLPHQLRDLRVRRASLRDDPTLRGKRQRHPAGIQVGNLAMDSSSTLAYASHTQWEPTFLPLRSFSLRSPTDCFLAAAIIWMLPGMLAMRAGATMPAVCSFGVKDEVATPLPCDRLFHEETFGGGRREGAVGTGLRSIIGLET